MQKQKLKLELSIRTQNSISKPKLELVLLTRITIQTVKHSNLPQN